MADRKRRREFALIKLNETDRWHAPPGQEHLLTRAGRIVGVYIADLSVGYHLCELTLSYRLDFIRNEWEGQLGQELTEREAEQTEDFIYEGSLHTESICYVHCGDIDNLPVVKGGHPPADKGGCAIDISDLDDEEDSEEDALEHVMEYIRGNHF